MLGILCGLESEAKIARRIPNALVACAAARPGKARALVRELIDQGATHIVSFGVAGGLQPDLPMGALVVGSHVLSDKGKWACDTMWCGELLKKLPKARLAAVYGSDVIVPTAVQKSTLHRQHACSIVDMESQCVAEIASAANLPFAVIRTVCDGATVNLPDIVMQAIGEDGTIDIKKAVRHILRHPQEIFQLPHVVFGMNRALSGLKKCLYAIG